MSITQEKSSQLDVTKKLKTNIYFGILSLTGQKIITSIFVKQCGQSLVLTSTQPSLRKLSNLTVKTERPYLLSRTRLLSLPPLT